VVLRRFHLNPGTGGKGFHKGGDGVIRELLFRRPVELSVLSERRAFHPYGLEGNQWTLRNKFRFILTS
jgi:5-oxoprolinase (ATP-hydrolysing)